MQCYKTFAATTVIANFLEVMPEVGRKLPHAAIAEWMAQHDIDAEDVLYATPAAVKSRLAIAVEHDRPGLPNAA